MNTEITIPVSDLKAALPGLAKIVPRHSSLPVLQCIKVSQDRDTIRLQAQNLNECATVRLPSSAGDGSGQILVPLDLVTKIAKGCAADQTLRLVSTGSESRIRYTVAGSPVERSITHIPASEWPEVKVINQEPMDLDDTFKTALKEAIECASEDSSRYVLNGACLDTRDKEAHYIVGTDGRHLYSANTFRFNLPESLIVPARKFIAWSGFTEDGPWKLSMLPPARKDPKEKNGKVEEQPAWFRIDSQRWSYVARAVDGQFPNWKQVLPPDTAGWTQVTLHPAGVDTIIEAVPLLPGGDETNRSITLLAGNGLVLRAKGRDQTEGTSINVADASVTGKAVQITLNRSFLLQALRFGMHQIAIKGSLDPLVFTGASKTMVVMPLRCEASDEPPPPPEPPATQPQPAPAATPSAAEAPHQTEERNTMSASATPVPERRNLRVHPAGNGNGDAEARESRSPTRSSLEHLDRIKTNLRDVIGDLNEVAALLKTAEKEQRTSVREIEAVRAKLREIQSVAL